MSARGMQVAAVRAAKDFRGGVRGRWLPLSWPGLEDSMGKRATAVATGGYVRRYSDKYADCEPWKRGDGIAQGVVHLPSKKAFLAYMHACQREKLIAHWVWYIEGEPAISMRRTHLRGCPTDLRDEVTVRLGDLV